MCAYVWGDRSVKMGAIMAKPMQGVMEENMKRQQEFMLASQRMQVGPTPTDDRVLWAWPVGVSGTSRCDCQ